MGMLLGRIHIHGYGPIEDLTFRFLDDETGLPRPVTVLFGGGGVGKSSILTAIASTRPGHAVVLPKRPGEGGDARGFAAADWIASDDDAARPHPLRVVSPNAIAPDEDEEAAALRRREQALFDRRAVEGKGFVLATLSGARWFPRAALHLSAPERQMTRYDPRTAAVLDDATRAELARETKQVLAYASIGAALAAAGRAPQMIAFDRALREALRIMLSGVGYTYIGSDPVSLEPMFQVDRGVHRPLAGDAAPPEARGRDEISFDDLPHGVRHLVAFAAIPLRSLFAAYPGADAREAEGVVLIDDAETQLDGSAQRNLAARLHEALPRVQWILATSSPTLAQSAEPRSVLALRRMEESAGVELFAGEQATLH